LRQRWFNPAAYADHRIHDSYRWLARQQPARHCQAREFDPFWVVTKHAHIQAVSRQNELFHNADRPTTLTNQAVEERVRKITGGAQPGSFAGANGCAEHALTGRCAAISRTRASNFPRLAGMEPPCVSARYFG